VHGSTVHKQPNKNNIVHVINRTFPSDSYVSNATVEGYLLRETSGLTSCELVHASVVSVVHEVV